MTSSRTGTFVASALGLAIAVSVGYALNEQAKRRAEQHALVEVVGATTSALRAALTTGVPGRIDGIEDNLRIAQEWRNAEVADATEGYLVAAREIVRRRADVVRLTQKAAASRAALAAHMARAAHRSPQWIDRASALKKQVERDHFDLDLALNALTALLDGLPDARKRLAPHVAPALLVDEDLRNSARREAVAELKRADAELARARQLLPR